MKELEEIWDEKIMEKIKDLTNSPANTEEAKNNEKADEDNGKGDSLDQSRE